MIKKIIIAVTGLLFITSAFLFVRGEIESQAVKPVAERLHVAPSRVALREYATELFENNMGASREEIHYLVEQLGGEVRIVDQSSGRRQSDRILWLMGEVPWGHVRDIWVLEYDSNNRLIEVHIGSS